ncbi:hypothetical protein Tco_0839204 [Tanacetum coccineum]|uniref:Reverse transcriptase domain-containing protein n=1 Tax=Tanacetum coccineum TaxID=301880 RepID=A0ABQ5ASH8_9ASTR
MESADQFIYFFCGGLSDEYGCPCSTCELCGNDAHYGYDCPSQVSFAYNQDPCFNQNLDNFPQTSPILLAEESILTVMQTLEEKQIDTESMQELLLQFSKDLPTLDSDEEIESSVKNLNLTPSESEDLSDYVSECDLPFCDNSPNFNNDFEIFSNPLFDSNADYTSSDDESSSKEDVPIHFLLEEFVGELALINPIPPGIVEPNFNSKEAIRLIKKLLYDNSSPRPLKELNSKISNAIIKYFSPSPIPVEDSDSLMEEIDIFFAPDDAIPPGIENDDYDSEGDILFLDELLTNDSF